MCNLKSEIRRPLTRSWLAASFRFRSGTSEATAWRNRFFVAEPGWLASDWPATPYESLHVSRFDYRQSRPGRFEVFAGDSRHRSRESFGTKASRSPRGIEVGRRHHHSQWD